MAVEWTTEEPLVQFTGHEAGNSVSVTVSTGGYHYCYLLVNRYNANRTQLCPAPSLLEVK